MIFKLDENIPQEPAGELEKLGHAADTVASEGMQGAKDELVLARVVREGRILVTQDLKLSATARLGEGSCGVKGVACICSGSGQGDAVLIQVD